MGRGKSLQIHNSITFLSLVRQSSFQSKAFKIAGDCCRGVGGEDNLFPFNAWVFLLSGKVAPCFQDSCGSQSTKGSRPAMVGSANGLAPNICSKLQTEPNLEVRQLVQQMANSPAPLGPEIGTIFFLSQGSLIPAMPEYRKYFWFFRNFFCRRNGKKQSKYNIGNSI